MTTSYILADQKGEYKLLEKVITASNRAGMVSVLITDLNGTPVLSYDPLSFADVMKIRRVFRKPGGVAKMIEAAEDREKRKSGIKDSLSELGLQNLADVTLRMVEAGKGGRRIV